MSVIAFEDGDFGSNLGLEEIIRKDADLWGIVDLVTRDTREFALFLRAMRGDNGKAVLYNPGRELSLLTMLKFWSWTFQFPNWEKENFCCKPPHLCMLWHAELTGTILV